MILDINKLPKKTGEINHFVKNDIGGCTLYSYSIKGQMNIVCLIDDLEIEEDFTIDNKALEMVKILSPVSDIIVDGKTFTIKSKKGNYKGKLLQNELFMKPNMNFEYSFKTDLNKLKIASQFCSKNEKKPILTGVNVNSNGDINATDSFIAFRYVNKENVGKTCYTITIPSDFIEFIGKVVDEDEITINFNKNSCAVEIGNIVYVNKLLDGNYPSLEKIFAVRNNATTIQFDIKELREKISISKNVGESKDHPIYLTFKNGTLLANGDNDFASYLTESNENTCRDYDFTISLNNFGAILNNITNNEKIIFDYIDSIRPLFVKDDNNEFLILPIRKD